MNLTKKMLFLFVSFLILTPTLVYAEREFYHSGTGTTGGGGGSYGKGTWNRGVYGIRVTFVDKNGKRLQLTDVSGTVYKSYSIDIYGNIKSDGITRVKNGIKHSNCSGYLCHKGELASSLNITTNNYNYGTQWYLKTDFSWMNFGDFDLNNQIPPSTTFKQLEGSSSNAKKYAKQLFEACFKIGYEQLRKNSGNMCKENEDALERSYIIYEPITTINQDGTNRVSTGSEFALYRHKESGMWYQVLPKMANYARISSSSCTANAKKKLNVRYCNLGLTFNKNDVRETKKLPVGASQGMTESKFKETAQNNLNGYFLGLLVTPLPPAGEKWQCDVTDYSIDAACVNCDEDTWDTTEKDKRASYIIQDTTNWSGILRSGDENYMCGANDAKRKTNANTVSNYFKQVTKSNDCGNIYCREEVKIVFPDEEGGSALTTERGRYFTVHTPFREADGSISPGYDEIKWKDDINILKNSVSYGANFGAIKVTKIRECRIMNEDNNTKDEYACLRKNEEKLKFSTPTEDINLDELNDSSDYFKIKLKYEGKLKNGEIDKQEYLLTPEPFGEFGNGTTKQSSKYDKIAVKQDGKTLSSWVYTSTQTTAYKLPETVNRYIKKDGGTFVSEKPETQNYIDLGIATVPVSQNNIVLTSEDATLTLSFELSKDLHLKDTFTANNDKLPTCTPTNTSSTDEEPTNIYAYTKKHTKITSNSNSVTGLADTDEEKKRIPDLAASACAKLHNCKQTGDGIGGCTKPGVGACIINRTENKIGNGQNNCYYNSKADSKNGNKNYICSVYVDPGIPDIPELPKEECPGCREEVYKDPNCIVSIGSNVCLPATGYNKLIYRPIDLTSPFPAKNGSGRETGANWCGYDTQLKKYSCSNENPVVNEYILNNRGVESENVYKLNPMYKVTLTPEKINEIQNYNNGKPYDDYNLICNKNDNDYLDGTRCEMKQEVKNVILDPNFTHCDINSADPKCEGGGS